MSVDPTSEDWIDGYKTAEAELRAELEQARRERDAERAKAVRFRMEADARWDELHQLEAELEQARKERDAAVMAGAMAHEHVKRERDMYRNALEREET